VLYALQSVSESNKETNGPAYITNRMMKTLNTQTQLYYTHHIETGRVEDMGVTRWKTSPWEQLAPTAGKNIAGLCSHK
jgi:hypothetical protein